MSNKLIVLMIDGVSAEYFVTSRGRLPHLSALAERGLVVNDLRSEVLGTSIPGRTSILTGTTADVSGIYGNKIWDTHIQDFRYANPYDVRVPTLPQRMKDAERESAVLGFGMVRPEDATIFRSPWWVDELIQRARDSQPVTSDEGWLKVYRSRTDSRFSVWCNLVGFPEEWLDVGGDNSAERLLRGAMSDMQAFNWVGIVASHADTPDLIMSEFVLPDTVQHYTGYKSAFSHWSIMQADAAIGMMLSRLSSAGVLDEWNIAIMSDHGHSPIKTAIHPHVILPNVKMQSEGSVLLVAPKDDTERKYITQSLMNYSCMPFHVDFVPDDHRQDLMAFVAPDRHSFELDDSDEIATTGKPIHRSSHGLRPGLPGDDRFAIFAGPDIPKGRIDDADAIQITPTCAKLLGLNLDDFAGEPLI